MKKVLRAVLVPVVIGSLTLGAGVLASGCLGCMGSAISNPREKLIVAVRKYNEGVHWGRIDLAAKFVPVARRTTFVVEAERITREIFYTSYEVKGIIWARGSTEAAVRVAVGWYHRTALLEKRTYFVQRWERVRGGWMLIRDEIVDGPPIGGVAPAEPEAPPVKTASAD